MKKLNYNIFTQNKELYTGMLADIEKAEKFVFLETYIFQNDKVGTRFKDILKQKAKQGIEVRVLLDGIGTFGNSGYFEDLKQDGVKLKFFREFKIVRKIINENNNRNHRKLLVIDGHIAYIGSSNIDQASLLWRELNIRIDHSDVKHLHRAFLDNWDIAEKRIFKKKKHTRAIHIGELEIARDVPSIKYKKIRKKQLELIGRAKKEVLIEVPYFLPDKKLHRAFSQALRRGVKVNLMLPQSSDVLMIDLLRQKYLGKIHEIGVEIFFFTPTNLHSKSMVVDGEYFSFGSANLNYRSLHLEFEINVFGSNKEIAKTLKNYYNEGLEYCQAFDHKQWKNRSYAQRMIEYALSFLKYFM
jgi:cardiolipin synthase A/B